MRPHIVIGSDHAGFHLKNHLVDFLVDHGYEVLDVGAKELDLEDDYPDFALAVGQHLLRKGKSEPKLGVLLCGNAEGVCIAANKVRGVRAAVGYSVYAARTTREDDDANALCLPARVLNRADAERILITFLTTHFSGAERHTRRLAKVRKIERDSGRG